MNDYVGPDSFAIEPSRDLPCSRLPFAIHQEVCRELDLYDRWRELAALEDIGLNSESVRWIDNKHRGKEKSCTSALLEHLWMTKRMTVGSFLRFLEKLALCVDVVAYLEKYLQGMLSEEECTRSNAAGLLTADPRKLVS